MEDVENAENLKFYKEQTLFEDKKPSFELSNEQFYNKTFDLYILPRGYQTIKFIPRYTGEYAFTAPAGVSLSISGTNYAASADGKYTVRLNGGGQVYYITLTNNGDDVVKNAVLGCNLRELDSESVSITGLGNYAVLYRSSCDGICKVQSSNADCIVKVLDIDFRELKNGNASYCYYNFQKDQQYVILVTNTKTAACSTALAVETDAVTACDKNTRYDITATDQETYIKYTLSSGYHTFEYSGGLTYAGCLQSVTVLETADTATGVNAVLLYLGASDDVVFCFSGSGSVSFVLYAVDNNYLWEVDGETYLTETATSGIYLDKSMPNRLYIQRGRSAVVKLKIGSLYFTNYVKVGDYSGISYNANTQILTANSNCDLINDSGSNKQYLLCMCNNYEIAVLQIYVTCEYSQVTFNSYGTDTTYGINYSAISDVGTDVVKATLLLGSSSRVHEATLNAAGGYIDIKPLMSAYNDVPTEFQVTLAKLTLNTVTTLYSSDTSVYRHFEVKNRVCTINQLFGGGSGTSGDPYLISSYKQLNNIRAWYKTNRDDDSTYINGAYKLTCDITLPSEWTPIEHNFKGEFDGNNKNIRNLKITVGTTGNYGFFKTLNNAFISNLGIDVANIKGSNKNTDGRSDLCVGALAGTATGGRIDYCTVQASSGTAGCIEVYSYTRTYVGGIVGVSNTRINNCENTNVAIKGYGYLGGIAGVNTMDGTLSGCENRANIYYEYDTDNGCAGGITGANYFYASVIGCSNYGTIYYAGEKKNDKDIAPYMAQIIGYNHDNGVYSGNNCYGSTDYSNLKEKAGGFLGIGAVNQKRNCSTGEVGVSE